MAEQLISVQIQEIQPSLHDFVFNIVLPEGGGKPYELHLSVYKIFVYLHY